jgi:hypothetical protein
VNFSNQIHDFDPGVSPTGVFWTVPVPSDNVAVHSGEGDAAVDVNNLALHDFFSLPNFFSGGSSAPAVVSYHLRWSGVTKRVKTRDVVNGFAGEFIENNATLEWSAQTDHFEFVSDPANTSTSSFAEVGHERNGVFFPQGG